MICHPPERVNTDSSVSRAVPASFISYLEGRLEAKNRERSGLLARSGLFLRRKIGSVTCCGIDGLSAASYQRQIGFTRLKMPTFNSSWRGLDTTNSIASFWLSLNGLRSMTV